jgi:phenylacetate-CoA ligase
MAFKDYFQKDLFEIQNSRHIKELQLSKLRQRMKLFYGKSPIIKIFLDAVNVKPETITFEKFHEVIPVRLQRESTELSSFMGGGGNLVDSIGGLCGIDPQEFLLLCSTSGTTGEPSPYFFTEEDLKASAHGFSRALWMLSGGSEEKIHSLRAAQGFALSMVGAGVPSIETFIRVGVPVIPIGAEGGTEKIFYFIEKFGGNLLFCTPSLAEHMLDINPERVKNLGLKRIMCGAEPGAGIPEVRQKLQNGYKCPLCDAMGMVWGLMWVSCDEENYAGMHHLSDDMHLVELVDPSTQEHIPFEDGAVGQIVLTPLVGSMPPIRTSSGDIVQVFTEPCNCGAPGWRMKVVGRADDMLKVKGVVVYPAGIDGVITGFVPNVTGEFRIILDEPPPKVSPPLKLKIEYGENIHENELENLENEIKEAMHKNLKIRPAIQWLRPMTLERSTYKTKFIEKNY